MKKLKVINLTPHKILASGNKDVLLPSGFVARVNTTMQEVDSLNGTPVLETSDSSTTNIPEPKAGTVYIVPAIVRIYHKERTDLLSPAKLLRDHNGAIIGCAAFERNSKS